jgi:hypothetical protein
MQNEKNVSWCEVWSEVGNMIPAPGPLRIQLSWGNPPPLMIVSDGTLTEALMISYPQDASGRH